MADVLYDKGREAFLNGDIDFSTDDIRVYLIDTDDYTFSAAHQYLSSVAAAARVAYGTLSSKSSTSGIADAADVVLSSVTGDVCEALILAQWDGSDSTSQLIAYMDSPTGLPVTPNGTDITIEWDAGSNKIFKL